MGCGSATPMRARSRAMPSSVIVPSATSRLTYGSDLVERPAVGGGGLAADAQGRQLAVDQHGALPRGAEVDEGLAPPGQLAAGVPRLLDPAPCAPARARPQQDALVVGPHRGAERADEL